MIQKEELSIETNERYNKLLIKGEIMAGFICKSCAQGACASIFDQIPRNEIIQRVLAIKMDNGSRGTCLYYEMNGVVYFITAKHVVNPLIHGEESFISIFKDNEWKPIKIKPYFVDKILKTDEMDLAILQTDGSFRIRVPEIDLSSTKIIIGQDTYFLGFPYFQSLIRYKPEEINNGLPIPFMKKATLSFFGSKEDPIFYLDGHNNLGFSGGPVVIFDHELKKNKIVGIISGYLNHKGKIVTEKSENLFYNENSGIGVAYKIDRVAEALKHITQ